MHAALDWQRRVCLKGGQVALGGGAQQNNIPRRTRARTDDDTTTCAGAHQLRTAPPLPRDGRLSPHRDERIPRSPFFTRRNEAPKSGLCGRAFPSAIDGIDRNDGHGTQQAPEILVGGDAPPVRPRSPDVSQRNFQRPRFGAGQFLPEWRACWLCCRAGYRCREMATDRPMGTGVGNDDQLVTPWGDGTPANASQELSDNLIESIGQRARLRLAKRQTRLHLAQRKATNGSLYRYIIELEPGLRSDPHHGIRRHRHQKRLLSHHRRGRPREDFVLELGSARSRSPADRRS